MEILLKMKYLKILTLFSISLVLILSFIGCSSQPASSTPTPASSNPSPAQAANQPTNKEITAFVGSSAKGAMDPSGQLFTSQTGIKAYFNYGGSGALLSQMELAKTGDLFIPASPDYIAKATADKAIYPDTEVKIYYLVPAIIVQKGNPKNIKSLADLAASDLKIAIADPKTVPAGLYAYEILDYNKMLTQIGKNIVVYGTSNEQICSYVTLKTVDAAIGWDVVAIQQPQNLDVVYLQSNQVPRISYMSGAVTTYTKDKESAQKFLNFLISKDGQAIFKQNGYYTTLEDAKKLAPDAQVGGIYTLPANYQPLVK
jgi:molybdate transport system substrate-binding protein